MCIIAAKPAGTPMPSEDIIRTMWTNNPDGAGLMYVENGHVVIEKGFMKQKDFLKALRKVEGRLDMKKTPLVMHFRIATHGGINKECTHPFPVTDNIGALQKIKASVDLGVAHNGIISSVTPRKGISDTMEYIATQLAPLKRALPKFYENKHARLLIQNAIGSRMTFLTAEGKIYTVGDFVTDKGILYSNTSYKSRSYRSSAWGCYGDWDDYADDYNGYVPYSGYTFDKSALPEKAQYKNLCWLDDGSYIMYHGEMFDGAEFLIDHTGSVYQYDYGWDCATPVSGAVAFNPNGLPARFNFEESDLVEVLDGLSDLPL